jgi:hypothetical protein
MAQTICVVWGGHLGEIDDATEEACVEAYVSDKTWIGLMQAPGAANPAANWTWNGTTPVVYSNWQSGAPNDADGTENGDEQCADLQPSGNWDDEPCSSTKPLFCRR